MSSPLEPDKPDREPSLWEELGLPPPPKHADERLAPEVDRELLLKFVRRELPEASTYTVTHLIIAFKSWADAHAAIVVEEFHRTGPHGE